LFTVKCQRRNAAAQPGPRFGQLGSTLLEINSWTAALMFLQKTPLFPTTKLSYVRPEPWIVFALFKMAPKKGVYLICRTGSRCYQQKDCRRVSPDAET